MRRDEKLFFLFLPKATKLGTFHGPLSLEPSKGHQAWNLSRATKHWNLPRATKLGTFQGPPSLEPAMVDMAFFARRWYSLMTLGSELDGGASSNPSTISQRSMEANTISILNFQRLKFSPLNLSMTLTLSPSKDVVLHSNSTSLPTYVFNRC